MIKHFPRVLPPSTTGSNGVFSTWVWGTLTIRRPSCPMISWVLGSGHSNLSCYFLFGSCIKSVSKMFLYCILILLTGLRVNRQSEMLQSAETLFQGVTPQTPAGVLARWLTELSLYTILQTILLTTHKYLLHMLRLVLFDRVHVPCKSFSRQPQNSEGNTSNH